MGTALVILTLLTLGGFVAYIGDLLGRRMGKKRLSILGLRPKHTAVVLTVLTGVLITLITFGAAMLSIPVFRQVVFQGERLANQNQIIQAKNRALEGQNRSLADENNKLVPLNRQLEARGISLQGQNKKLTGANTMLSASNARLESQSAALRISNQRLQGTNVTLNKHNQELRGSNDHLTSANRVLTRESESLRKENTELQTANTALEDRSRQLRTANNQLNTALEKLRNEQTELQHQVGDLRVATKSYKEKIWVVERGYEFMRRPIPKGAPLDVLERTVQYVVYETEQELKPERLAALGIPRCWWAPPRDFSGTGSKEQYCAWVARKLRKESGNSLLLRVIADENCVKGRPVPIRLDWCSNDVVFHGGDLITQILLDGRDSEGNLIGRVIQFLQSQVRIAATTLPKPMLPDATELGKVSYDQVVELSHEMKKLDGPVVLKALAKYDTRCAGPLHLDLRVEPL